MMRRKYWEYHWNKLDNFLMKDVKKEDITNGKFKKVGLLSIKIVMIRINPLIFSFLSSMIFKCQHRIMLWKKIKIRMLSLFLKNSVPPTTKFYPLCVPISLIHSPCSMGIHSPFPNSPDGRGIPTPLHMHKNYVKIFFKNSALNMVKRKRGIIKGHHISRLFASALFPPTSH